MKYVPNDCIVEAFRIGIDPIPVWFRDMMTNGTAKLGLDGMNGNTYARFTIGNYSETVPYGDYIIKYSDGQIRSHAVAFFETNFMKLPEDEPVNAAEPVDPEKERLEALNEYYHRITSEVKLIFDAFVDAGFRADEAFTLMMKLMENPVKPCERKKKEDILRDFTRLQAERKERLEK